MRPRALLCLLLGFASGQLIAQPLPKSDPPIERLYQYPILNGRSPSGPQMAPDGSRIAFGWNRTGIRRLDLWVMSYPGGEKKMIVDSSKIEDLPRQDDSRTDLEKKEEVLYDGGIGGARWSPDSKLLMFSYKGRTWLVKPDGRDLHPLVDGHSAIGNPDFSPDGRYISYNSGPNLYRYELATGAVRQLTFLSKADTSIDQAIWSPDSKQIAVFWTDSSKIGNHVMMDFSKDRATVVNIKREWNGDLSVNQKIGLIGADGGIVRFIGDLPSYLWVLGVEWSPDSTKLAISWLQGDDKKYTLTVVPAVTLRKADIYTETAEKNYLVDWRPVVWSRDSKTIYLGTDALDGKFANRSVVAMDFDGRHLRKVYAQPHDVGAIARPKDSDRLIVVTATPTPLQSEIKIIEPDGKIKNYDILPGGYSVPKEFNWAGLPIFSDDGTKIATLASCRTLNNELYSVEPRVKRLTESQLPDFKKVAWADVREVTFPGPEGATLHGLLITKPGLDLTKKHPAFLSSIYADSAKAAWNGYVENYAAMNLDMVVLCVDFRSSWGYGGEFNTGYYRKMGLIDADEAVAAKNYLASLPYVRPDRVGIWGWSYGGFLTCMTLLTKPGVFHAGVAVAPVTDWKNYNEWYTRRRLGLVKDDAKIFEQTSPITYASGLQDELLLVHGMLDDNVLFQDTERLIQRLIDNGKYFEVMTYPRDDHGIGKDTSRPHVYATIVRYLWDRLGEP
jgi:dipeptidyl-peptidase-4